MARLQAPIDRSQGGKEDFWDLCPAGEMQTVPEIGPSLEGAYCVLFTIAEVYIERSAIITKGEKGREMWLKIFGL